MHLTRCSANTARDHQRALTQHDVVRRSKKAAEELKKKGHRVCSITFLSITAESAVRFSRQDNAIRDWM